MTASHGRYIVSRHYSRWAVRDLGDYDADAPIYQHRWQAEQACRRINAQHTARANPAPTLFDKEPTMTQPSIWDELDDGDFRRVPDGETGAGSPLIIPEGGGDPIRYQRATHFIGAVEDDIGIQSWKRHLTVDGMLDNVRLQQEWRTADWHGKKALAHEAFVAAGGEVKANNGTRMHTLTDAWDGSGLNSANCAEREWADISAYAEAVRPFTLVHAEVKTVCDQLQVAGTPDRIWDLPGWAKPRIGDLKTGKIDGRKCAMQLALYAHSRLYDVKTGQRTDLDVDLDVGMIVHLPYGEAKARVLEVDLVEGWRGVLLCAEVHAWRRVNGLTKVWKPPAVADPILAAIALADSKAALGALWREKQAEWTDAHTAAAKARTAALTAQVAA